MKAIMKVTTIGPVHHDGAEVEVGTVLTLPVKAARQLIDAGAAEAVDKAAGETDRDAK